MAQKHVTHGAGEAVSRSPWDALAQPRTLLALLGGGAAVYLTRHVLWALGQQLLAGYALMALALPLCRALERRVSATPAALLALTASLGGLLALPVLIIPPLAAQLQQLTQALPGFMARIGEIAGRWQQALRQRGLDVAPLWDQLLGQLGSRSGEWLAAAAGLAAQAVRTAGKLILAPLIGFYLLRDRRRIAGALTLLAPVSWRGRAVRAAREMRRETVQFLRGQLLLSLIVGVLTAAGLWAVGTPAWLVLGLLMGVMELLPYVGPLLAGIPAVLLSLQGGLSAALWSLLVLLAVQQLEGSVLAPRLLSGATQMHPLTVLLLVSAGGMLAGPTGMLLAVPAAAAVRGAARGLRTD